MIWTEQDIQVAVSKRLKSFRRAYVSEDGLFAIHPTYDYVPGAGYTITHVPSGYSLSEGHSNQRNAELFAAIWRALPLPWKKKQQAIANAHKRLPVELQKWIKEVRAR